MKSLHRKALLGKFLEPIAIVSARDGVSLFMPSPPRQQREKKKGRPWWIRLVTFSSVLLFISSDFYLISL